MRVVLLVRGHTYALIWHRPEAPFANRLSYENEQPIYVLTPTGRADNAILNQGLNGLLSLTKSLCLEQQSQHLAYLFNWWGTQKYANVMPYEFAELKVKEREDGIFQGLVAAIALLSLRFLIRAENLPVYWWTYNTTSKRLDIHSAQLQPYESEDLDWPVRVSISLPAYSPETLLGCQGTHRNPGLDPQRYLFLSLARPLHD